MSAKQRRLQIGEAECGVSMSNDPDPWIHVLAVVFGMTTLLFSYAALLENGIWHSVAGFIFGFVFLFYLHGQTFDRFYLHIGERIKIGGDAYDPDPDNSVTVEYEEQGPKQK